MRACVSKSTSAKRAKLCRCFSENPMNRRAVMIGSLLSVLAVSTLRAQQLPNLDALKHEAAAEADRMQNFTQQAVDQIFSFSELGFQEYETTRYLTGVLEKNG